MYRLLQPLLFALPPETAHRLAVQSLRVLGTWSRGHTPSVRPQRLWGLDFANPIGIAAGFDKDGTCTRGLVALGCGFLELGTVTLRPQPGNARPRLFRLANENALINRMGFNNAGANALALRLRKHRFPVPVGVNIGCNKDCPVEQVVQDYCDCLDVLLGVADFVSINISSPNTPGLRDWAQPQRLAELFEALYRHRERYANASGRHVPLLVKLSPDQGDDRLIAIARRLQTLGIEGVIATNTTLARPRLEGHRQAGEQGGLSGRPLAERATQCIRLLRAELGSNTPIIGVGGIDSVAEVEKKLDAGASLVQLYTGLIYKGPGLIRALLNGL